MMKLKNKKKGFTLIELIIVIAIIAILAAISIPKFGEVRKKSYVSSDVANAKTIANAATALLAEGEITAPKSTTKTLTISASDTNEEAGKIEGYLQSMPTPKSKSGSFIVEITSDAKVTVKADGEIFFPR